MARRRVGALVVGGALVVAAVPAVVAVLLPAPWLWAVAALCVVAGIGLGGSVLRPTASAAGAAVGPDPVAAPAAAAAREVDDLPGFFASPPGSPPALPAAPVTGPVADGETGSAPAGSVAAGSGAASDPDGGRRRGAGPPVGALAVVGGVVVAATAVAVTAAVVADRGSRSSAADPASATSTTGATTGTATGTAAPTAPPAPLTAAAAGDLADTDVPPGEQGFTAELTFPGIVLEPRAVGVTVTYPVVRLSGDGASAVAHLELPLWNCLAADAPADPVAAGCSRSLAEFADLGSPDLRVGGTGSEVELEGAFATYTRPNGTAPAYTGRSYTVTVRAGAGPTGVTGTLTLGDAEVRATGEGSVGADAVGG